MHIPEAYRILITKYVKVKRRYPPIRVVIMSINQYIHPDKLGLHHQVRKLASNHQNGRYSIMATWDFRFYASESQNTARKVSTPLYWI